MQLIFPVLDGEATIPATVVSTRGGVVRARFDPLTMQEEEALTMVLYSRADTWLGWGETREVDKPMRSLGRIFALSMWGYKQMGVLAWKKLRTQGLKTQEKAKLIQSVAPVIALAVLFGSCLKVGSAAQIRGARAAKITVGCSDTGWKRDGVCSGNECSSNINSGGFGAWRCWIREDRSLRSVRQRLQTGGRQCARCD